MQQIPSVQWDDFVHFHEQTLQIALHLRLCQCPAREWCCYPHRQRRRVDHHTSMNTAQSQKLREAVAFAIEHLIYIYIFAAATLAQRPRMRVFSKNAHIAGSRRLFFPRSSEGIRAKLQMCQKAACIFLLNANPLEVKDH